MDLLGSDSSSEDENVSFKINENYAKNYEKWRKKEEKQKLIDKYGDAETSSSSSEEEEIRSTPQIDKDWLRAYAVVRFRQPRLYKKGEKFFHEIAEPVVRKKEKALTLKDHERKFLLEKGGVESDNDSEPKQSEGKSYFEEQEEIKQSFKEALADSGGEDSDEEDKGLLVKREKTAEEQRKEENEYLEWLKGEREELEDKEAAEELAPLKAYWNDPNLNEKERVLRDYILNNGYMDQEESDEESSDDEDMADPSQPSFDAEEEFLEAAEEYEHKYNFRHEEPGGTEIRSYPRVIETSVRTRDTRRAEQRKRKMEKKKAERDQKKDEIRLLQKLQQEEKKEKLETIRKIAKNPNLDYDLEADFDPEEHNRIMQKFFSEDYYGDNNEAGEKPTFEFDATIDDEPDDWWGSRLKEEKGSIDDDEGEDSNHGDDDADDGNNQEAERDELYADDPNFVMDVDFDPTRDYKAEKKRSKKYGKALAKKLPVFDPTTKSFDEYMDEYLKDKIDQLPFPYREVMPNDFGLSTEEILKANEKELNAWVSVKKMSQYRSNQEELVDKRKFAARGRQEEKKLKVIPSLLEKPGDDQAENDGQKKKKKKRRKRKKKVDVIPSQTEAESATTSQASGDQILPTASSTVKAVKRKRKDSEEMPVKVKKKKTDISASGVTNQSVEEKDNKRSLVAQRDLQGRQKTQKMKKKKEKQQQTSELANSDQKQTVVNGDISETKKKEKKLKSNKNDQSVKQVKNEKGQERQGVKKKKKRMSISNFGNKDGVEKSGQSVGTKGLKKQLSKVMSAARLSKYGLGPSVANAVSRGKKKRKKQQANV